MLKVKTMGKSFSSIVKLIMVIALVMTSVAFSGTSVFAEEWDKPGFIITFQDEFNGTLLDTSKWNDCGVDFYSGAGALGEAPEPAICPGNVSVSGGYLHLKCSKETIICPDCLGNMVTRDYRVGYVNTKNKFQQTYGWWEARIKFPSAKSIIPAFWLMPHAENFSEENPYECEMIAQYAPYHGDCAEVDIMEYETYWMENQISSSLWYGGYDENFAGSELGLSDISDAADWHVYALNWEPGKLEIYVDGVKTQTYTGAGIPFGDEITILSMSAGTWGHALVDSELPGEMLVDYIRVYTSDTPYQVIYNDNSPNYTYNGHWSTGSNSNDYLGDYHSSNKKNNNYYVNFTGTGGKVYARKDSSCGKAAVYVDDVYKTTIDCYRSSTAYNQLLYDTGALPYENHNVRIVVLRQKNSSSGGYKVYADKFEVSPGR